MNKMRSQIFLGMLLGFAANILGMFMYILIFIDANFTDALYKIKEFNLVGSIIALGAAINFLPFFILLNKNKVYMARGVLIATILAALVTLVYKLDVWFG